MEYIKYQLPDELGGGVYNVIPHIPHKVLKAVSRLLPKSTEEAKNMPYEQQQKIEEIVLTGLVRPPPDFDSDECNGMAMGVLATAILEDFDFTGNRIIELKKKVLKL